MTNPFDRVTLPSDIGKAVKELIILPQEDIEKAKAEIDRAIAQSLDTATKNALTAIGNILTKIIA